MSSAVAGSELVVTIDKQRCVGHGRCYSVAPEVYDAGDDATSFVINNPIPSSLAVQATEGAESCPEHAITVQP